MKLQPRDRRALVLLAVGVVLVMMYVAFSGAESPATVVAGESSVPLAEKRVAKLRRVAATVPVKKSELKGVLSELATREKGVILADTAAQAEAHLLQNVRRLAKTEGIDVRGGEFLPPQPLGDDYGEVAVAVSFECQIEQLVNLLADLTKEPELLATREIRVTSSNAKDKKIGVRVMFSGITSRKLVPARKGITSF